jgi:hypothetical protein
VIAVLSRLPVRYERPNADNRVVDVLRKFIAHRLTGLHVGLADKIIGGREPAEVGHSFEVPDDDSWFHAGRSVTQRLGVKKEKICFWVLQIGPRTHKSQCPAIAG